jgi:hypothetical protein
MPASSIKRTFSSVIFAGLDKNFIAVRITDIFESHTTKDPISERHDDLTAIKQRLRDDPVVV